MQLEHCLDLLDQLVDALSEVELSKDERRVLEERWEEIKTRIEDNLLVGKWSKGAILISDLRENHC